MIRQLKIQQYSKSTSAFRPEILSSLILLQKKPYQSKTHFYQAFDTVSNTYFQVYISHYIDTQVQKQMEFVRQCPKVLLLKYQSYNLMLQQKIFQNLQDYFTAYEAKNCPNLSQIQAQGVLRQLVLSIEDYYNNQIVYGCISPKNIVRLNSKWVFSLAGALTKNDYQSRNFYDMTKKGQAGIIYALGTLLFKMIFGFVPFQAKQKKPTEFKLQNYIKYLDQETYKKLLKVYYFSERIIQVSKNCENLLQKTLSGQIKTLKQLKEHLFFNQQITQYKKSILQSKMQQKNNNRQVKMISYFKKEYHSLVMAAIQRRKKYPFQRINSKPESELSNFLQLKDTYKKDPFLSNLGFAPQQALNQELKKQQQIDSLHIPCKYFQGEFEQDDSPCMDLLKFIEKDQKQNPRLYQTQDRQSQVKLYAFPYVMVFELAKVYNAQSKEIKKYIQQLIKDLLQISALHPVQKISLHNTKRRINDFNDIKLAYRQKVNALYKYFLMQAMKRYNNKKEGISMSEKIKLKEEGLEYYKLCLKLMEASVINRKLGKDLDLQRIVTSQRKQVQSDLQTLLKTYFPNKVELK